jgi:hypothetical protein
LRSLIATPHHTTPHHTMHHLDIGAIIGALLTNENGAEFRAVGLSLSWPDLEPTLWVCGYGEDGDFNPGETGLPFKALSQFKVTLDCRPC